MDKPATIHTTLQEALAIAAFDGWSEAMAAQACKQAGVRESEYIRACPNGAIDLLDAWMLAADEHMAEHAENITISSLKVRERIKQLVLCRLHYFAEHREAMRRACHLLATPWHMPTNLCMLHRSVDRMWHLAGDNANDYNWYTKRLLLSGVYSSTLMYWLNDDSADFEATQSFLDRRIENVMQVGQWVGKFKQRAA